MAVFAEAALSIPATAHELMEFRLWAQTEDFPEQGRIDFLQGGLEIDMSPEDLYTHGTTKLEISTRLQLLVTDRDIGCVFSDRTRISSPAADLSVEPDVVVVLWESLEAGRVREIHAASGKPGRYVELEGAPDLVVEIVGDSSQRKDLERLPKLYAKAGVPELWLIDARGSELHFEVRTLEEGAYRQVAAGTDGWTASEVLGKRFRLARRRVRGERWVYRLDHRSA